MSDMLDRPQILDGRHPTSIGYALGLSMLGQKVSLSVLQSLLDDMLLQLDMVVGLSIHAQLEDMVLQLGLDGLVPQPVGRHACRSSNPGWMAWSFNWAWMVQYPNRLEDMLVLPQIQDGWHGPSMGLGWSSTPTGWKACSFNWIWLGAAPCSSISCQPCQ